MSDEVREGPRKIREYRFKGYKIVYIANRGITRDDEIRDIPLEGVVRGGPALLAVVPEGCRDYDALVGMESEEALELLREERDTFVEALHGAELYNGVYRRIRGDWDEYGFWVASGSLPDLFGDKESDIEK